MDSSLSLVRSRRAEIAKLRQELDMEDADLAVTERTLERLAARPQAKPEEDMVPVSNDPLANKFSGKKPSIKDLIVRTLAQSPDAWAPEASWVWESIRREFGVEINKNSFYPQISSLVEHDGLVVRDGKRLALLERVARR